MSELATQILLFVVSVIANFFSAMAGGGAGLLQLPAIIFFGLSFSTALATHKVASVALGVGATIRHLSENSLERRFALFILISGLPGVVVGAFLIIDVPDRAAELALGMLTISLAVYSFLQKKLGQSYCSIHRDTRGYLTGALVLFLIGVLNGSLTSGTGLFVTIWLVKWFGLDYKRAVAYTLILVGLFWNGTGAITLGVLSSIQWHWLPALLLGSLIGGFLGAHISLKKSNRLIKRVFEIMTLLAGLKLIIG
ncbi:MAG: sulfite exporter TauE/SafE family protein [Gammaproteobacteria bacterium]|nr:sulfite exporter TauE/SafE family protein [Gammaproteobacteria bacterium]